MKIRQPKITAKVAHPLFQEVIVTLAKPKVVDLWAWQQTTESYTPKLAAINPETGRAILGAGGAVRMLEARARVPLEDSLGFFAKHVINVEGIDDVEYTPETANEILTSFLDPAFNFKQERDVPMLDENNEELRDAKGKIKTERKEVDVNFYGYLSECLTKEETFRPLALTTHSELPVNSN